METENKSALAQGVKLVGIGKHGSKKLPVALITQIKDELLLGQQPDILVGAFVGALLMKDIDDELLVLEEYLGAGAFSNHQIIWDNLLEGTPTYLHGSALKLMAKDTLSETEALELGKFLLSNESGEAFRGLAVSILRIRYETMDEYKGLFDAIVANQAKILHPIERLNIQLSEPFDGVDRSYMITPNIVEFLQQKGHKVVVSCGRSSGPKNVINSWDIYKALGANFIQPDEKLDDEQPKFGQVFDQKDLYPALDGWVDKRRVIMKRPFLATLEKVLNPLGVDTLITSVFHIPYLEKMLHLGFMAGFKNVLVLKRGQEGTLGPSLAKATGLLCATRTSNGNIIKHEIDGREERFNAFKMESDDDISEPTIQDNLKLVHAFSDEGSSGNEAFDKRIAFASQLYLEGLDWLAANQ